jgi:hypothetical protein
MPTQRDIDWISQNLYLLRSVAFESAQGLMFTEHSASAMKLAEGAKQLHESFAAAVAPLYRSLPP